jgi:hypothetical protein
MESGMNGEDVGHGDVQGEGKEVVPLSLHPHAGAIGGDADTIRRAREKAEGKLRGGGEDVQPGGGGAA